MHLALMSIGTRGDMEPFLAVAGLLRDRGHRITCVMPEQFAPLAAAVGAEFRSLGPAFIELLDSPLGRAALGGAARPLQKIAAYARLSAKAVAINRDMVGRQQAALDDLRPDRVLHNAKCTVPVLWGLEHAQRRCQLSPIPYLHPVPGHPHVGFPHGYGRLADGLSYRLAAAGLAATIRQSARWLNPRAVPARAAIAQALASAPTIYAISPALFPRPPAWPDRLQICGYHGRPMQTAWEPDARLRAFLARHPRPLFITFGSMTNPAPARITRMLIDTVQGLGLPALINTAAGGLERAAASGIPTIHVVDDIPYDWAFARVRAVIHHGGSGTTHMALRAGCPNLIIPHIADQYGWADLVAARGAGPAGIPITRLTPQRCARAIRDLVSDPSYRTKAADIATAMADEDLADRICQAITAPA